MAKSDLGCYHADFETIYYFHENEKTSEYKSRWSNGENTSGLYVLLEKTFMLYNGNLIQKQAKHWHFNCEIFLIKSNLN